MHNGYNKGVEPPSVPFSYLLYMRYAKVLLNIEREVRFKVSTGKLFHTEIVEGRK